MLVGSLGAAADPADGTSASPDVAPASIPVDLADPAPWADVRSPGGDEGLSPPSDDAGVTARGTTAAEAKVLATNLLTEPGFESAAGWTPLIQPAWPGSSLWRGTWAVAAPHSGTSAYAISNHAYGRVKSDLVTGISPGEPYDVALWLRGELDTGDSQQGVKVRVHFLDASNAQISVADVYNELSSLPTDWTKVEGQVTPPAGTAKIQVSLWFYMASGWVAFDDVYLGHFKEQVNLLTEPGFESASGWTPVTIAGWPATSLWRGDWGTGAAHTGSFSYVISNHAYGMAHSDRFPVTAGESYDVAVDLRGEFDLDDTAVGVKVRMTFYDDPTGGNLVGNLAIHTDQTGALNETWQRVGSTVDAPNGAVSARITLQLYQASGWVAFDEVQVSPAGTSTNLVANPGFEMATGWTAESASTRVPRSGEEVGGREPPTSEPTPMSSATTSTPSSSPTP